MSAMDPFLMFAASLPLRRSGNRVVIHQDVRPWNGRALTTAEIMGAWSAAYWELKATASFGLAAQAAHEWLSEYAW